MLDFKNVRIPWQGASYPPYHQGLYIEEYFYDFYIKNKIEFDNTGYTLLPIFWTTAYLLQINLEPYINALPKNLKYFCVAQHDDGVKEKLPADTIVFSAGGNSGGIPLPLVCSPIPEKYIKKTDRDILCSFVGSTTHEVRKRMSRALQGKVDFVIKTDEWSWYIGDDKQADFFNTTARSKFTLCPRGYGAQSFRFYEALQLGSVPIYVHDNNKWRPYADVLDWDTFSISIHIDDIHTLPALLREINDEQIQSMITTGSKVYKDYFSITHIPTYVLNTLKNLIYENN